MAVKRDNSYAAYAPKDLQRLTDGIAREKGVAKINPVWTVGRLDERPAGRGDKHHDGNGHRHNGNGNGNGATPEADAADATPSGGERPSDTP